MNKYSLAKWAALGCLFVFLQSCTPDETEPEVPPPPVSPVVRTGAMMLQAIDLAPLHGKRVGLIVNHTAQVGDRHIIDVVHEAPEVELVALFGPEHGIRGEEDAGEMVEDGIDPQTGVPIYSLYQAGSRKPAEETLEGIDVLVFDIQDIGARFYTYISTLGLTMQAAAEQGIAYMVLDRPNPLGGTYVSGYVLEEVHTSFVGQYPIPVAHGMTVGELAQLIKGEALLEGLESLDLSVIKMEGWTRGMTWDQLNWSWMAPSPNIPDFQTALVYAGTCFFEAVEASEGRGTRTPFLHVGSAWGNAEDLVSSLQAMNLKGVSFEPAQFTPEPIEGMSGNPRFSGQTMHGVRLIVTDAGAYNPVEVGIHVLHTFYQAVPEAAVSGFINDRWLGRLAGTDRLGTALRAGESPQEIIDGWGEEVAAFKKQREGYLLYTE